MQPLLSRPDRGGGAVRPSGDASAFAEQLRGRLLAAAAAAGLSEDVRTDCPAGAEGGGEVWPLVSRVAAAVVGRSTEARLRGLRLGRGPGESEAGGDGADHV